MTSADQPRGDRISPWAYVLTVAAGLLRLVPTAIGTFNLTPVGGLCIFAGARLKTRHAIAIPLILMFATDLALYLFQGQGIDPLYAPWHLSRLSVYASFLVYVALGRWVIGSSNSPWRIGSAALLGTTQFFLLTNFDAWLQYSHLYPRSFAGLVQSYLAGVPFVKNTLLSDLIFTGAIFAVYALLWKPAPQPISEKLAQAQS